MTNSKPDHDTLLEVAWQMEEAISVLMCAEGATQEKHTRIALGVAIGNLVGAWQTVSEWKEATKLHE